MLGIWLGNSYSKQPLYDLDSREVCPLSYRARNSPEKSYSRSNTIPGERNTSSDEEIGMYSGTGRMNDGPKEVSSSC